MSVIRVQKSKNFTTMSNIHLRDRDLSLKAKGLMSVMLSLPDDWNYSVAGLCAICKEKETAVKNTLNELRERRYVIVERIEPSEETGGRIQYEYFVYEQPQGEENKKVDVKEAYKARQEKEKLPLEKQGVENLGVESLAVENIGALLNTNISNTDILKTKEEYTDYPYDDDDLPFKIDDNSEPNGSVLHNSHNSESKDSVLYNSHSGERERRISMSLGSRPKQEDAAPLKDMPTRAREMARGIVCDGEEVLVDGVGESVEYFLSRYREKNGREHMHLKNDTLMHVVEVMLSSLTVLQDGDLENSFEQVFFPLVSYENRWEDRKAVIDRYFDTDFREQCDYSLVHFVQGNVITCIMQKCYIGGDMEWFYNEPVDLTGERYE